MTDNNNGKVFRQYVRKNAGTIIMFALVALLIFSPDTKAWVMRQLLRTGLFNAHLTKETPATCSVQDFGISLKMVKLLILLLFTAK